MFLFACEFSFAQTNKKFPENFIGNWKGELNRMVAGRADQKITVRLRIQPADSADQYIWHINYGEDQKDDRPYIIKPVDAAKGYWIIDEGDGIKLDSYVHGNSLHGAFTVEGSTIIDNYSVEENKMRRVFHNKACG